MLLSLPHSSFKGWCLLFMGIAQSANFSRHTGHPDFYVKTADFETSCWLHGICLWPTYHYVRPYIREGLKGKDVELPCLRMGGEGVSLPGMTLDLSPPQPSLSSTPMTRRARRFCLTHRPPSLSCLPLCASGSPKFSTRLTSSAMR